ncbi:MAG: Glycosyltransferase [Acetothermia bacterium 64_32]|nr:MAG: Glycosyltransferase [Acetothermia bacterium 64_32]
MLAAAHLGYDPRTVPIGGGAQVAIHLLRHWAESAPFSLTVLGSGPMPPALAQGRVRYQHIPWHLPGWSGALTELGVRGYASFSRQFERGVTEFLRRRACEVDPTGVCVVHNDICEAGDFRAIAGFGYRQVAIFHVDVVDYAANIYLGGKVSAPALARLWRGVARLRARRLFPDVVRLILEKQEACARFCQLLVVPSEQMAQVLLSSYPWLSPGRVLVVPWGAIVDREVPGVEEEKEGIKEEYRLDADTPVLISLSRISPEKGQDLFLKALCLWERRRGERLVAFICGAPAFIHGKSYLRRLLRLARRLRRVEVHFPGYVSGARKAAFLELSDLYVFPSRHESYGLTLVEALAAGLPVLTTDHRSARDLVRPQFGLVVRKTPEDLYRGLVELLKGRERLPAMGAQARAFARDLSFRKAAERLTQAIAGSYNDREG